MLVRFAEDALWTVLGLAVYAAAAIGIVTPRKRARS